jgi:hypothetical protein
MQRSNTKPAVSPKRILAARDDFASLRFIATIEVNPPWLRSCRGRNKFSRISIRHVGCSSLYTQDLCSCCAHPEQGVVGTSSNHGLATKLRDPRSLASALPFSQELLFAKPGLGFPLI